MEEKKYNIGIICGSFDLIHPGYIYMFKDAKNACSHLVVALQGDPTIDRPEKCRPVQDLEGRKAILESIRHIDTIVEYNTEKELSVLLANTKHDVRILGSDYEGRADYTGASLNKPVYYHHRNHNYSTTALKEAVYEERLAYKKLNNLL
jgi:glycerol-3-phosphate cytidylyltransferase